MRTEQDTLVAEALAGVPTQLFVDGVWRPATSGRTFDVHDPATGNVLATVADGDRVDAKAALSAAVAAADGWAATSPRVRADLLRAVFDELHRRADQVRLLMTLEMGKPLAEARGELAYGAEFLRWFSEEAVRVGGHFGTNPEGTGRVVILRRPVGPTYLVTPWNFPLAMATRKLGPALAAGCTTVLKPAELTPLTSLLLTSMFVEAGLPPGVLNVVTTTDPAEASDAILRDSRLRKLSFTGSTPVGRQLLADAAPGVLRTSMELGGNAAFLVFADADLDAAVGGAMLAKFRNTGQACTAANRFLVHRDVVGKFTERLEAEVARLQVGPGTGEGVQIGPLISADAVARVHALVQEAVQKGATVVTGGTPLEGPGNFYAPTIVTDVPDDCRLLHEEIFGPVVALAAFDDDEEAIRRANASEFGLVSYAFTRDLRRGLDLVDRLESGMTGLNAGVVSSPAAPFGGIKHSGLGREGGREGIEEYLETKYAFLGE